MPGKKNKATSASRYRLFRRILWWGLGGGILLVCLLFFLVYKGVFGPLPTFEDIENPESSVATEIISADGQVLGKIWKNENRSPVKFEELSPYLVDALIATEDERFREHSGVDVRSTVRAVVFLGSKGGASTLTQQLAKQLFTKNASQNKVERGVQKLKEWIIAAQLERSYTKDEIITMYFNKYDFLYNAYGVKNASQTYFNKLPADLKIEEAAVLVGMAKNPILYNPIRNPKNALSRRNQVFRQMKRNGFITAEQLDSLLKLPLETDFRMQTHTQGLAQYFREYVREAVNDYLKDARKPDGSKYSVTQDGLRIYTSIDSRMQRYAEQAVNEHLSNLQKVFDYTQRDNKMRPFYGINKAQADDLMNRAMKRTDRYRSLKNQGKSEAEILRSFSTPEKMTVFTWEDGRPSTKEVEMTPMDSIRYYKGFLNAGFLAVEPQTGYVKAWVGGINYRYFQYDHVIKARRQTGSIFKPFVYATAIDQRKMSPCFEYIDQPVTFPADEWSLPQDWTPRNSDNKYDYMPYTLITGLAKSKNSITASIVKDLGTTEPIIALARKLGVTSPIDKGPAMCLGSADISLYEMIGAFSTFANKGSYTKPIMVTRIEDRNGIVLYQDATPSHAVMSEESSYAIIKLLEGVTKNGTGARLRASWANYQAPDPGKTKYVTGYPWNFKNPIAGKTGTSQNQSDGWFVGMVPNLAAGAWVGCEDRAAHFRSMTYGQGATSALPIWAVFMKKCYADPTLHVSKGEFEAPSTPMTISLSCERSTTVFADGSAEDDVEETVSSDAWVQAPKDPDVEF